MMRSLNKNRFLYLLVCEARQAVIPMRVELPRSHMMHESLFHTLVKSPPFPIHCPSANIEISGSRPSNEHLQQCPPARSAACAARLW